MQVQHNKNKQEFFIVLDSGSIAFLQYELINGVIDLWHTEVPHSVRGQGIAKHLAKAAFDYAVHEKLKIRPTCTYLQKYLIAHPKEEYLQNVVSFGNYPNTSSKF